MKKTRVRAFLATSLDGYIAGPDGELDWLSAHTEAPEDTFTPFFSEIGAMLMGRHTFDVVSRFDDWPYGDTPVLVATTREIVSKPSSVRPVRGSIEDMIEEARGAAGSGDIYVDGGALVRSTLAANLLDELTLTVVPVLLGAGISLFEGVEPRRLQLESSRGIGGGMVQIRYVCSNAML